MITRLMTASVLALGLLASTAMAGKNESGYCGKNATYDNETLTCIDSFGGQVEDRAGFAVGNPGRSVGPRNVGDFIDETVTERNERSGN